MYTSGLHLIATLETNLYDRISTFDQLQIQLNVLIAKYNLHNLGDVYHNFFPSGYTAMVCLSESHISVHTWPEYKKINLDIYLSNYQRVNNKTVESIFEDLVDFFQARIISQTEIIR